MDAVVDSDRLRLRPWTLDDAGKLCDMFRKPDDSRWLPPVMELAQSEREVQLLLGQWTRENGRAFAPVGRWAIELRHATRVIGQAAILYLPTGRYDHEIAWDMADARWQYEYAAEAVSALANWALQQRGVRELCALVSPNDDSEVATARRIGMKWVRETDRYYGRRLREYRITGRSAGRRPVRPGALRRSPAPL